MVRLEDTLARRTFDESGDYAVRGFDLDIKRTFTIRHKQRYFYIS